MADDERFNRRACDKRFETIEHDVDTLERDAKNNLKWRESIQEKIGALYGHIDDVKADLLNRQDSIANRLSMEISEIKTRVTLLIGGVVAVGGLLTFLAWIIDKVRT